MYFGDQSDVCAGVCGRYGGPHAGQTGAHYEDVMLDHLYRPPVRIGIGVGAAADFACGTGHDG
jgi:hypothetical protein